MVNKVSNLHKIITPYGTINMFPRINSKKDMAIKIWKSKEFEKDPKKIKFFSNFDNMEEFIEYYEKYGVSNYIYSCKQKN